MTVYYHRSVLKPVIRAAEAAARKSAAIMPPPMAARLSAGGAPYYGRRSSGTRAMLVKARQSRYSASPMQRLSHPANSLVMRISSAAAFGRAPDSSPALQQPAPGGLAAPPQAPASAPHAEAVEAVEKHAAQPLPQAAAAALPPPAAVQPAAAAEGYNRVVSFQDVTVTVAGADGDEDDRPKYDEPQRKEEPAGEAPGAGVEAPGAEVGAEAEAEAEAEVASPPFPASSMGRVSSIFDSLRGFLTDGDHPAFRRSSTMPLGGFLRLSTTSAGVAGGGGAMVAVSGAAAASDEETEKRKKKWRARPRNPPRNPPRNRPSSQSAPPRNPPCSLSRKLPRNRPRNRPRNEPHQCCSAAPW